MTSIRVPPGFLSKPVIQVLDRDLLVFPDHEITLPGEELNLSELLSSLIRGGVSFENAFRARELHKRLNTTIGLAGGLRKILPYEEISRYSKVLGSLERIAVTEKEDLSQVLCFEDAESLTCLVEKVKEYEEEVLGRRTSTDFSGSVDSVLDGISEKIITILLTEALVRGSYINVALGIARLNPKWDIPYEADIPKYLKSKVLTRHFKNCLKERLKGNVVNKEELDSLQKKFFYFANGIVWVLSHLPEFAIKYLPYTRRITRLSVNIIHHIPIIGLLINSFLGPVDEIIGIVGKHGDDIRILKRVAKQARRHHKFLSKAMDAFKKIFLNALPTKSDKVSLTRND